MWLRVEHTTTFAYEAPIVEAYTELRLRPLDVGGQRCASFQLATTPAGTRVREYRDHRGNSVSHFDLLDPHQQLVVTARSNVFTPAVLADSAALSLLDAHDYLEPTSYIALDGAAAALAAEHAGTGTARERATSLMSAIRAVLVYEPGATTVTTRVDEVLSLGRGVCQDFAHVLIAACRAAAIPARYVSGYLHDPAADGEAAASHAWVDIHDDLHGWVSLDPTHDREQDESYVRVAIGRDYADVPPTRGVFKGTTTEALSVQVNVGAL